MNKIVKFLIGLSISIAGLWYALHGFNWSEFVDALKYVNYWYLTLAIAIQFIAIWLRALRWQWLLLPVKKIPVNSLFDATMIGYFGNMVLPLRMGEVLRAYVVSNKFNLSTSKILGTLVIDRILDMLALMVFAIFFVFNSELLNVPQSIVILSIVATLIIFISLIYIGGKNPDYEKIKTKYNILNTSISSKIYDIIANLLSGLSVLTKTPKKVGVYSFIGLLWSLYFISFLLMVKAVNLDINIISSGVLYVLLTIAISIPAAPGYVGTYHATCVAVLINIYSIDIAASQAFAIISHAAVFIPFVIVGAVIFVKNSLNFSKIKSLEISES